MKHWKNEKYASIALYSFITICASVLLCLGIVNFSSIMKAVGKFFKVVSPLTYGFVIAYLCAPLMNFIEKKILRFKNSKKNRAKLKRALAVLLTYLIISAFISAFFILLVPQIAESYNDLSKQIGTYITSAQEWADNFVRNFSLFNGKYENLSDFLDVNELTADINAVISNSFSYLETITNYIINYAGKFVVEVKNVIIGVIIAVYFLYSKEKLAAQTKKLLSSVFKRKSYLNIVNLTRYTHEKFGSFITGKLLDSLIVGLITFIATGIFGIPFYPLISLVIGITNVIPVFGPIIGAIPTGFIVLIAKPGKLILFLIIIIVIQQLDGNIIGPKILGDSIGISGMWVVISITVGGGYFGITGMVLGVPTFAVIYALVKQESEKRLRRRGIPTETDFYSTDPPRIDFTNENVFIERGESIPEKLLIKKDHAAGRHTENRSAADTPEKDENNGGADSSEEADNTENEPPSGK